jgi:hypothetical protein
VEVGVKVNVGVGDSAGVAVSVAVSVGVGDSTGVDVSVGKVPVGVGDSTGVEVSVGRVPVGVGDSTGVAVSLGTAVGVADSTGVEVSVGFSVPTGVGVKVAVGALPLIVTTAPDEERGVSTLLPVETRTVHSTELCPACNAVTLKVKAGPLVVALLPLLPAMATMKLPP